MEILQWMEERPLMEKLKQGNDQAAIQYRPPLYRCPSQLDNSLDESGVKTVHYIMEVVNGRRGQFEYAGIRDRFEGFTQQQPKPWLQGPTTLLVNRQEIEGNGPHGGQFNY